jgi:hypothetical protein
MVPGHVCKNECTGMMLWCTANVVWNNGCVCVCVLVSFECAVGMLMIF